MATIGSSFGSLGAQTVIDSNQIFSQYYSNNFGTVMFRDNTMSQDYRFNGYKTKNLKEYTEEQFAGVTKDSVVKDILVGAVKVPKEDVSSRIAAYLKDIA